MGRHAAVLVAVALLLAGCVGGQGGTATTTVPEPDDAGTATTEATSGGETNEETSDVTDDETSDSARSEQGSDGSRLNFYVSDEQNAMGDFAHLNVTISEVGLKSAGGGNANWTTFAVENRTVDLTRLQGANATRLGTFVVRNGTYETVFIYVSEVNGTLTNGEQVRVKLPSEKLQIHQTFEIAPNQTVDYVFDVSVFKAGKSGKYVLKPVISQSGTDKEIEDVDEKKEDEEKDAEEKADEGDNEDEEKDEGEENETEAGNETDATENGTDEHEDVAALNATFVGNVTRGENATLSVTSDGSAVANATVEVNGEVVGETDADGTLTFSVPDVPELEVEAETEDGSVTLKKHLKEADRDEGNGNEGSGGDG